MGIPLNIDWQQILLHWLNLAILIGGLYFILYKPVKNFMDKREAHFRSLEEQAEQKLRQAEQAKADYRAKLDAAEDEIREKRAGAQKAAQEAAQEQLAQAKAEAKNIIAQARAKAEQDRDRSQQEMQREMKELAVKAAEKLVFQPGSDPFDEFLDLAGRDAERGEE